MPDTVSSVQQDRYAVLSDTTV